MKMAYAFVIPTAQLVGAVIGVGLALLVVWAIPDEAWDEIGIPLLAGALASAVLGLTRTTVIIGIDPPAAAPQADSPSPADGAPATATPAEQEATNAQD